MKPGDENHCEHQELRVESGQAELLANAMLSFEVVRDFAQHLVQRAARFTSADQADMQLRKDPRIPGEGIAQFAARLQNRHRLGRDLPQRPAATLAAK